MNKSQLLRQSREGLQALAAKAGIEGYLDLTKAQLVAALLAVTPTDHVSPSRQLSELPACYGRTQLTLMEIDPSRLHAFWELTPQDFEAALKRLSAERDAVMRVIRFYDVTKADLNGTNTQPHIDVPISSEPGSCYLDVPASGGSYRAELGLRAVMGDFVAVCRSNVVHLPRAEASAVDEPQWMRVEDLPPASPSPAQPQAVSDEPASAAPDSSPCRGEEDVVQHYEELLHAARTGQPFVPSLMPEVEALPDGWSISPPGSGLAVRGAKKKSAIGWQTQAGLRSDLGGSFVLSSWALVRREKGSEAEDERGDS